MLASLHFDPNPAWALKLAVGGDRVRTGYQPFVQARLYVRLKGG